MSRRRWARVAALPVMTAVVAALLTSCSGAEPGSTIDPAQVDTVITPLDGACRLLVPADLAHLTNATEMVSCSEPHTAETFAVGTLPLYLDSVSRESQEVDKFAYDTCQEKFEKFVGADESLALRTILTWAWFRPSDKAWEQGARWYRCDVVAGSSISADLPMLPTSAESLLAGFKPDDRWMVCANGPTVADAVKVPCSEKHTWRAVSTIKVGEASDPYPGDERVEILTRDYCRDSVGARLNYPDNFEYGYTWFTSADWQSGNRRSVCWDKTPK